MLITNGFLFTNCYCYKILLWILEWCYLWFHFLSLLQKLKELGVGKLILPAVLSALNTWTHSFKFTRMTATERLKYLNYTFLDFQDTIMCQKHLMGSSSSEIAKGTFPCLIYGDSSKRYPNQRHNPNILDRNGAGSLWCFDGSPW